MKPTPAPATSPVYAQQHKPELNAPHSPLPERSAYFAPIRAPQRNAMRPFVFIDAPSCLGLFPSGVETLPQALRAAGLTNALKPKRQTRVELPLLYSQHRQLSTFVLNSDAIKAYAQKLAKEICPAIIAKQFPIVLGGDCSILIGNMLGLRRMGRFGLCFLDGHADFYSPKTSSTGQVADMDLAILTGRGPEPLTNIDNLRPLVKEQDTVIIGYRDREEFTAAKSPDVKATKMLSFDLHQAREHGIAEVAELALERLNAPELEGFWIHLDADVLNDNIMPAVDYRLPNGFRFEELSVLLKTLMQSPKAIGMDITIFNPRLDPDGSIARAFVRCLADGLTTAVATPPTKDANPLDETE